MPNELANFSLAGEQAAPPPAQDFQLPPPLSDVAAGKIPGVRVPPILRGQTDELQETIIENYDRVVGQIGVHDLEDNSTVFFNPDLVTEKQIDEAFENGTLDQIAPPVDALVQAQAQAPVPAAEAQPAPAPAGSLASVSVPQPRGAVSATAQSLQSMQPKPGSNPVEQRLAKRPV